MYHIYINLVQNYVLGGLYCQSKEAILHTR